MKIKKIKIGKGWFAKGYGRKFQNKDVFEINGFAYSYYPKYAQESFEPLKNELKNYVPLNLINLNSMFFYQVNPTEHQPINSK